MWTPTIDRVQKQDGRMDVDVSFSDGTQIVQRSFRFTEGNIETVKTEIRKEIARLSAIDSLDIPIGAIDPTPKAIPEYQKTPREIYAEKVYKLKAAKRAVELGVLPANAPALVALQGDVAAGISWEYADLF